MFHQPISRNQRTKGSNVKTVLQVLLLLSIAVWLLYQMKHSYNKRMEYSGTGDVDAYLGRKGKAGSENVIDVDTHEVTSDESVETNEAGGGQVDAVDEDESLKKGDEASEERQNEDDAVNNDLNQGKEEVLDLTGEESDSTLGKDNHRDGGDDSFEREVPPKDNSSAQSGVTDEVKSDGQVDMSDEHTTEISETTGNTTIEDASTNARSDDESLSYEHKDEASNNTNTSERDTNETPSDNIAEADTTETGLDKELPNSSISTEGDSNGTTKTDELESKSDDASGDSVSEEEKFEKELDSVSEEEKFEKELDDKLDDQTDMQREEVEAQGDSSDAEIATNNVSVEEKTDHNVDKIVMPANTEDSRVEAIETLEGNASDAENTDNLLPETKAETKSEDEVANSSQSDDEPQGGGGFETRSSSENALQDTEPHLNSNGQTNSESGR